MHPTNPGSFNRFRELCLSQADNQSPQTDEGHLEELCTQALINFRDSTASALGITVVQLSAMSSEEVLTMFDDTTASGKN